MNNKFYLLVLCTPALYAIAPAHNSPQQEPSTNAEEFPTVAINFTIHNNHHIKQDNANSSSSEQTVQGEEKEKKKTIHDSLLRFMRIISEITFR